ncbi:class I SAM-dependent methyltransferase [Streptomyces silvisoli]|uniref:Class I SAM-dependent methyltransferase n=1 Tax=Streptomyces silvisoli TaxID=3034235 RepID=A0ABT5ZK07_9ACTN|nr:class I SAM-dependent methyltransferase [Streptomyces silvisoli]MDF3290159.1 class I SAM-dependent methyltransferase [Streptomyces silvisoli]
MGYTQQDEWHEHYARGESFRALTETERAVLDTALRPQGPAVALDVGCGLGELALHLHELGYVVDAVDYAESAIERAAAQAPDGVAVRFLKHDIEHDDLAALPPTSRRPGSPRSLRAGASLSPLPSTGTAGPSVAAPMCIRRRCGAGNAARWAVGRARPSAHG